jgi:PIN domain nuclease of toxin-antitoxin system
VLDASALLAAIFAEKGSQQVIARLPSALLSAVNLAEVATRALDLGQSLEETIRQVQRLPLQIIPYDAEQAHVTASLRPATKPLGLSLGDRACLALGMTRGATVLTADRLWGKIQCDLEIIFIR